jgi:hypothetical protein
MNSWLQETSDAGNRRLPSRPCSGESRWTSRNQVRPLSLLVSLLSETSRLPLRELRELSDRVLQMRATHRPAPLNPPTPNATPPSVPQRSTLNEVRLRSGTLNARTTHNGLRSATNNDQRLQQRPQQPLCSLCPPWFKSLTLPSVRPDPVWRFPQRPGSRGHELTAQCLDPDNSAR